MTAPVALVVPLFDEADRFAEFGKSLVDFVRDLPDGSELVFVDDGSTDATVAMVEELAAAAPDEARLVRLLRRPHEGKGAAVAAGIRSTTAPLAGFCDLDLSTPLDDLATLIDAAARADVLAIASRDAAGSRLVRPEGRVREALGRTYNRLLQAVVTPGIVDTQCGAKVARREVWDAVLPWCNEHGFAWDAEVVAVAMAKGIAVREVPVAWRHDERSKVRLGRDGAAMVAATPRVWRSARRARHERWGEARPSETHWWFRSKAAYVATALKRATDRTATSDGWLVDVGGGDGGVTARLGWRPDRTLVAEPDPVAAKHATNVHGLAVALADAGHVPVAPGSAAVVTMLDVLEHLDDPVVALRDAAVALRPGGRLILTVPAHPWLWSKADAELGHRRRYTRVAVRDLVAAAGLHPVVSTHVFAWLVPALVVERRWRGRERANLGLDRTSMVADRAALVLTAIERRIVTRIALPIGSTILCVAERR